MQRSLVSTLPHPVASALQFFLDEDLPRSADELSELFVTIVEYAAAVAAQPSLADAHVPDPSQAVTVREQQLVATARQQVATARQQVAAWAEATRALAPEAADAIAQRVENLDDV